MKHILCSNSFFLENRAVYGKSGKILLEPGRPQMTTRRTRIACCVPQATDTQSENAIVIDFPLPQWLQERASMLRYT